MTALPAAAQEPAQERPTVSQKRATASSTTVNLVNLLVKQGVLDEEQAAALIKQAEDEAYVSRQAARDATAKADEAARAASAASAAAAPAGSKRVAYVPEIVKRELREDIRKEVMGQAKAEGWASPGKYPEWASRIRLSGDIRGRSENIWYPEGGYNSTGQLVDYNAINTGSPYDVSFGNLKNPPYFNTTEDRNRFRVRARLGLDADLAEGFTAGMRIATGSDSSSVSTNQTLGGSGGNFSKYSLWLDRAFLNFEPFKNQHLNRYDPGTDLAVSLGRFDNPFWTPTDLVWDGDLGFDGIAVKASHDVRSDITVFGSAGAFPIFNTSLDFATTDEVKFDSEDRYLYGGQAGVKWRATQQIGFTFGAGVYEFENVQGDLSSPCAAWDPTVSSCDTDHKRPSFAQKGNTYSPLRDIIPDLTTNDYAMPQYFGLASEFRPVVVSGRVDLGYFDPVHVAVDGEFVWNSAFDKGDIEDVAINNFGPSTNGSTARYEGGDIGWMTRLTVGHTKLEKFGDWNASVGYKYLQSDAVIDAFADSDFGLGGTNLKGYIIGANVGLAENVSGSLKWMSADAISGAPYAVDTLQIDINAKF